MGLTPKKDINNYNSSINTGEKNLSHTPSTIVKQSSKTKKTSKISQFVDKTTITLLIIIVATYITFLALPILSVFLKLDLTQISTQLQNPAIIQAIELSLYTALIATLCSIILAIPTGYFLATRKFYGKTIIDTLMDLPLVLPPAVAGIALLYTFAPGGLLGPVFSRFGIIIPGYTGAVILAQIFVASPFLIRSVKIGFEKQNQDVYNSAKILTGSRIRVFFTISLPLAIRAIISGIMITWARAMGEFGATLMFAGNLPGITQTIPLAIYNMLYTDPLAGITLSIILIATSFTVIIIVKLLEQKKYGDRK
ncbi:MAG: molybdate ABC transporter permease subunit [Candidatus Bathyarchaeota archaeon]|nr:molybdate ABC transporter permease subunit [Candidatus Termiticorpusculum sp.]